MQKKKILIVVGTRPNFIKVTQFKKEALKYKNLILKIVHTGQHYDQTMSGVFFKQFNLEPDYYLNADNSSVISQMSSIMSKLETLIINEYKPDLIIVPGDVNSTLASALVANKLSIKLAHLESGLRSYDKDMPEEHNRILTDHLSDYLFVTEQSGLNNISKEGLNGKPFFVGNTMIDSVFHFSDEIDNSPILKNLNLKNDYILMTMHRPSNVDNIIGIKKIVNLLVELSKKQTVVFPIHPRTLNKIKQFDLFHKIKNDRIIITSAMGYFEFQHLIYKSKLIITDSGGIQEESTYRQKPCLTLRENTERPSTITIGSNELIGFNTEEILIQINKIENNTFKKGEIPKFWDGFATQRILEIINTEILN